MADESRVQNTLGKMAYYLNQYDKILCSVSGGSDSDIIVHMIATYFREYISKIHFVFVNTGLEYQATRDHLDYLERRYDIHIERIRGMPVPAAIRKYGVPIISKNHSKVIRGFCRENPSAQRKVYGQGIYEGSKFAFTSKQINLSEAVKARGISISEQCCDKAKKEPIARYIKELGIQLNITGERRAEAGQRATTHKSCFEKGNTHPYDKYMPLFFWDDDTKAWYKDVEGIRYSDCYEVWGMKRTGCVGCPCNSKVGEELGLIKKYEPKLYKACIAVFGTSYRLMDEFGIRRVKILEGLENDRIE